MNNFLIIISSIALFIFLIGMIWRWVVWLKTPVPCKIPTTPCPKTTSGIIVQLFNEIIFFRSLLRLNNKPLWAFSWFFHISIVLILITHFFNPNVFFSISDIKWIYNEKSIFIYFGLIIAPLTILYLLIRRIFNEKIRFVSIFDDYFALILLLFIVTTGIFLYSSMHLGLEMDSSLLLPIHVIAVVLLLVYFPFSKLVHAGAVILSPTRNQPNNNREVRHINPWDNGKIKVDD